MATDEWDVLHSGAVHFRSNVEHIALRMLSGQVLLAAEMAKHVVHVLSENGQKRLTASHFG